MGFFNILDSWMDSFCNQPNNEKSKTIEIDCEIISEETIEEKPLTDEEFRRLYPI